MAKYTVEPFISSAEIENQVKKLAGEINNFYDGKPIVVVAIMKGSFMFVSDLVKQLSMPMEIEFMSISSYGNDMESSGNIRIELDVRKSIEGKDVLVVEDLIDTGNSLNALMNTLKTRNPERLNIVTLLKKPTKIKKNADIRFNGFTIDDTFVVGYGMDYAERWRNLPYIGKVCFQ